MIPDEEKAAGAEVYRRRGRWFWLGLLPGILWPIMGTKQMMSAIDHLILPRYFELPVPALTGLAATAAWLALCAWRLAAASEGYNNGFEIKSVQGWFGLLVLLNIPFAACFWFVGCVFQIH